MEYMEMMKQISGEFWKYFKKYTDKPMDGDFWKAAMSEAKEIYEKYTGTEYELYARKLGLSYLWEFQRRTTVSNAEIIGILEEFSEQLKKAS